MKLIKIVTSLIHPYIYILFLLGIFNTNFFVLALSIIIHEYSHIIMCIVLKVPFNIKSKCLSWNTIFENKCNLKSNLIKISPVFVHIIIIIFWHNNDIAVVGNGLGILSVFFSDKLDW